MQKLINTYVSKKPLKINQANIFYNYTLGFGSANIDLPKTGTMLLKAGISKSVFFSDYKYIYIDKSGSTKIEQVKPEISKGGSEWKVELSPEVPSYIKEEVTTSCQIAFHETQFQHEGMPYLRASLPPIVLDNEEYQLPLYASVKIYSDGIAILSFQLDATWEALDESYFLSDIVNIYNRSFKAIWVDSNLQKIDAKVVLKSAFEDHFSIAGKDVSGWKVKRLIRKMKLSSQKVLDNSLQAEGNSFQLGNTEWLLHQIAGTENSKSWESTVEQCRSIYFNSISSLLVSQIKENKTSLSNFMWEGRPSISLLRFENQPDTKKGLYKNFSRSISKILLRADKATNFPTLPPDLRAFDDFCLHANRAIFLWTWLRAKNSPKNAWDDADTPPKIYGNQARTEQIEYHNMNIARACSWAQEPFSNGHLLYAYKTLARSESIIHQSSSSGEVTDALFYLIDSFGTKGLVNSGKEAARYHLDELKYNSDKAKSHRDSRLTFIFGLVGVASLAQFAIHPLVIKTWPLVSKTYLPIVSFGISGVLVCCVITIMSLINNRRN